LGGNGRASPEQSSVIDKAIADYTKAIQLDPNFVKTYNNRAIMYLFKGDTDRAFSDFSQIIQRFPNDGAAYFNRGHIYSDKKDYDRAIVDYTEAIRLTPNVPSWGYNSRGNAYQFGKGDYDHAIADYTQAIRIDPINGPYYGRGRAYWFKKEYDQALLDLNQAIRLNPNGTEELTTRGTVYAVGKRDLNRAIADWEAVLRIDPNHKAAKENLELAREMLGR
jgi:tetratricopeptide (TPR) repeat protein